MTTLPAQLLCSNTCWLITRCIISFSILPTPRPCRRLPSAIVFLCRCFGGKRIPSRHGTFPIPHGMSPLPTPHTFYITNLTPEGLELHIGRGGLGGSGSVRQRRKPGNLFVQCRGRRAFATTHGFFKSGEWRLLLHPLFVSLFRSSLFVFIGSTGHETSLEDASRKVGLESGSFVHRLFLLCISLMTC